jgi:hypothetical protein
MCCDLQVSRPRPTCFGGKFRCLCTQGCPREFVGFPDPLWRSLVAPALTPAAVETASGQRGREFSTTHTEKQCTTRRHSERGLGEAVRDGQPQYFSATWSSAACEYQSNGRAPGLCASILPPPQFSVCVCVCVLFADPRCTDRGRRFNRAYAPLPSINERRKSMGDGVIWHGESEQASERASASAASSLCET